MSFTIPQAPIVPGQRMDPDWLRFMREMYNRASSPICNGQMIKGVTLSANADTTITHTLGREPEGYFLVNEEFINCDLRVYRATNQSINSGTPTPILFDTENYGHGNESESILDISTPSGQFIPPVNGIYSISYWYYFTGITTNRGIWAAIYDNGTYADLMEGGWTDYQNAAQPATVLSWSGYLTTDQKIELVAYHVDGVARSVIGGDGGNRAYFRLIRETGFISKSTANLVLRSTYEHDTDVWVF